MGSIPAWAGKPPQASIDAVHGEVHPRVGGETASAGTPKYRYMGPSPRGRGNRDQPTGPDNRRRSIPAWAGKPQSEDGPLDPLQVHPRVGGETHIELPLCFLHVGPSPRGRGNHGDLRGVGGVVGSIPAWAGKPSARARSGSHRMVHPRVGGETMSSSSPVVGATGPSPRGRGNHIAHRQPMPLAGSIPAWAGKPSSGR